ncbi:Transaldolase [Arachis hypogaea]|nr:Transaldolase [Arachis hypogaea]
MRTVTLQSPPYAALSIPPAPSSSSFSFRNSTLFFNTCLPQFRASSSASTRFALDASSIQTASTTELDAVSAFSEIVPDTVIFDDFEKFPPTAATVSSSLLLGICGLPDTIFRNAVDMALADSECYGLENTEARLSCFSSKALVNVGGDMAKLVPGRVSTEVDARLAYDTHAIIRKVHDLLKLYNDISIPPQRLLFKIPSTWQGIEAARLLESEGIQTHLTFVYSFAQAAAAAQAGASVIQILLDWARNHLDDPEIESAQLKGEDPGLALVTKAYNYIHKYGHKSKLMAAAVRNKQDLFSLLGVDYIIAPLKILQSLKESIASPDEKYSFVRKLSPQSAASYVFRDEELVKWDQASLAAAMGPAAVQLLATGLDGHADQAKRVEELLGKIWPPPNV